METTREAIKNGFETVDEEGLHYHVFKFGDGYELAFEPLMFEDQMYVALYKDKELLTNKVVVKPGYED